MLIIGTVAKLLILGMVTYLLKFGMVILIIAKASLMSTVVPRFSQFNYLLNIDPKIKTHKNVRYFWEILCQLTLIICKYNKLTLINTSSKK